MWGGDSIKIVTNENYFEDDEYMSVSAFKKFRRCELDGTIPFGASSDAMLIGSYVDAFIEGTLDKFKEEHPEILRQERKIVSIEDGGIDIENPIENIMKIIKRFTN